LRGGTPTTLASGFEITHFAVGAKSVVYTNYTGCVHTSTGHVGYELMSVPIEGGTPTTLFSDFSEEPYPAGVTIDQRNVYWTHGRFPPDVCQISVYTGEGVLGGTVLKIPLGGGTPTTLISGRSEPRGIVVDETNVYWVDGRPSTVMSVPIEGGTPRTLASCQDAFYSCMNVTMDRTYVYWTADGNLQRTPRGGGVPEILVTATISVGEFAVDATNLYWVDLGDGSPGAASLMKLRLH
jgi:hypothetical protein